jgi:hypothetical protein
MVEHCLDYIATNIHPFYDEKVTGRSRVQFASNGGFSGLFGGARCGMTTREIAEHVGELYGARRNRSIPAALLRDFLSGAHTQNKRFKKRIKMIVPIPVPETVLPSKPFSSPAQTKPRDSRNANATTGHRFAVTRWWSEVDSNCRFRLFKRKWAASLATSHCEPMPGSGIRRSRYLQERASGGCCSAPESALMVTIGHDARHREAWEPARHC